jgi:hypothetical protein
MPLNGRDDRALDALIVLAFLEPLTGEVPSLSGPEPELDPEDERALDGLGPDLVRRILGEDQGR